MLFNKTVKDVFGVNATSGAFGVEIEIEGLKLITPAENWLRHNDGSLKGKENAEYVLPAPLPLAEAQEKVLWLYNNLQTNGSTVDHSMRAGVHIHRNCQALTLRELFTFMAAYYALEIPITERLGPDRVGNLFCLRLVDAEYLSNVLYHALTTDASKLRQVIRGDSYKYAALNLETLTRYGSLEFRALQTPTTAAPIVEWMALIEKLFIRSLALFKSPDEVFNFFSANGEENATQQLLQEQAQWVLGVPNYQYKIFESIRAAQLWVYSTNWSK